MVVDKEVRLVGIVTHGDFFRLFSDRGKLSELSVSDVMTRDPKRIGLDARGMEALDLMRKHSIDELPVVDGDDRVVGLIDIQDMIARGFSVFDTA